MSNLKAFEPVVHKKNIFNYLSFFPLNFALEGAPKGPAPYMNISESPNPTDASYQVWLKLAH